MEVITPRGSWENRENMHGKQRIALMGGTFNPVHNGHLVIAEMVKEQCAIDKVLFLPAGDPPHKSPSELIEKEHRYAMVVMATIKNPCFHVSRMELERVGLTYTVDTLREFRKIYPDEKFQLYYIIGADTLLELHTWRNFQEVFLYTDFIAVNRPGISTEAMIDQVNRLYRQYGKKINMATCPMFDASSTDIRRRVREKRSIRYLVPEEVEAYIKKNGLYEREREPLR